MPSVRLLEDAAIPLHILSLGFNSCVPWNIRTPKLVHDCSVNYELTLCSRHRLSLRTLRTITVLSVSLLLHTGKIQIFPLLPSHHIVIPFSLPCPSPLATPSSNQSSLSQRIATYVRSETQLASQVSHRIGDYKTLALDNFRFRV